MQVIVTVHQYNKLLKCVTGLQENFSEIFD